MPTYQTPQFMIDLLKKVQDQQIAIARLNKGHSLFIELYSRESLDGDFCICIYAVLFSGHSLLKDWYFSPIDDAESINIILEDLTSVISSL